MVKLIIIFLASLFTANCLISELPEINLSFYKMNSEDVGKKGTAVALFNPNIIDHQIVDTNKDICFKTNITNGKETYEVSCGLWSEEKNLNDHIKIFCNIDSNIPAGEYNLLFYKTGSFNYKDKYKINFIGSKEAKFKKVDKNIIDLYGGPNKLLIEETIDSFQWEFNIVSYNQEVLFLNYDMPIENCITHGNKLSCTITRDDFLAYFPPSQKDVYLFYRNEYGIPKELPLTHRIEVFIREFQNKDIIFVGITKLLVNISEPSAPFAYETNVTDISKINIKTESFKLIFKNKLDGIESEKSAYCNFFKYEIDPLYIVCGMNDKGTSWLKEITEEIIIDNYSIQYNFRIQPVKNEETIIFVGNGTSIIWSYPRVLDFTKTSGPFYIKYEPKNGPTYLNGLTYNENEKDLDCKIFDEILQCEVPKSHFNGKKNGYYYLKHTNNIAKKSIPYEISPIKVILEDNSKKSKGSSISLSINYLVLLILIFI